MLGTVISFGDLRFGIYRFNVLTLAKKANTHCSLSIRIKEGRVKRGLVRFCRCTSLTHGSNVIGHFPL